MLTLRLPRDSLQQILDYPGGLLALRSPSGDERVLVIKGTKEMLLAAKLRKELKVYVVTFTSLGDLTAGLVTAFFDDEDEPLFIASPLLAESESEDLREAFLQPKLDVHFFDELGRELLGYRATLSIPPETRGALENVQLYPPTASLIRAMWEGLPEFMATRTAEDDEAAITVSLDEAQTPEDLFVMEARPYKNLFRGSPSVRHSSLVRAEPGKSQEWDIIDLLHRTFKPTDIFHGPVKVTDGEEVADVIVATDTHVLVVQAKDSPNTEQVANNKLSRKRATALKSLAKGLSQVRGACRYLRSEPHPGIICGDKGFVINLDGKVLTAMVICKELFDDQYGEYSRMIAEVWTETRVPCIALDYMELTQLTAHVRGEEPFFKALDSIHTAGQEQGTYPRPRFWPGPTRSSST